MDKEQDEVGKETNPKQEIPVEEKTFTPEEQLAAIQAELKEAKEKWEQSEKGLRTAHQTLTEKDKVMKRLESERADISSLSAKVEVLGGMLSELMEGREESHLEEETPKKKVDYAKKFQEVETMSKMRTQIEPRQRRAEALGIPMTDLRIATVEYLTTSGQFDKADKALDALEAEANKSKEEPKEEKPKETEAERIERLVEEKTRQFLEEKGLLRTEAGGPSGAGRKPTTKAEAARLYSEGKLSDKEYAEWRHK